MCRRPLPRSCPALTRWRVAHSGAGWQQRCSNASFTEPVSGDGQPQGRVRSGRPPRPGHRLVPGRHLGCRPPSPRGHDLHSLRCLAWRQRTWLPTEVLSLPCGSRDRQVDSYSLPGSPRKLGLSARPAALGGNVHWRDFRGWDEATHGGPSSQHAFTKTWVSTGSTAVQRSSNRHKKTNVMSVRLLVFTSSSTPWHLVFLGGTLDHWAWNSTCAAPPQTLAALTPMIPGHLLLEKVPTVQFPFSSSSATWPAASFLSLGLREAQSSAEVRSPGTHFLSGS